MLAVMGRDRRAIPGPDARKVMPLEERHLDAIAVELAEANPQRLGIPSEGLTEPPVRTEQLCLLTLKSSDTFPD